MANITQINTWQMYAKDGRAVFITYDYENAPLGVLERSGPYSPGFETNLDVMVWDRTQPHARICD